eukprot:TRINITY_DN3282_c0_g1_i1.p1 TRINITY_DN3282_c0_g1~~TRINITY_DN3282_c0_g1_i1.p1  ORF type:complete len:277 (+),score=116.99 TRINITY_DN3282_c0_g1_i1:58-831(+)
MALRTIATRAAPAAIGPYCQAVSHGETLYVSGCIGLDEKTMNLEAGLEAQTDKAMRNLGEVLKAGGSSISQVIRTTVYLTKMSDFASCNAIYSKHFGTHRPARACIAAKELPKGALFEIDAIASLGTPMMSVSTQQAPAAIGPYCQAVAHGNTLYASGCIGLDEVTMELETTLEAQTDKALRNLGEVLKAAGSGYDRVIKTTVYLTDMSHFAVVNGIYSKYFGKHAPARACVAAKELPKGALFEVDAIAALPLASRL